MLLIVGACDSPSDVGGLKDSNVKRVMYWGSVSPDQWEANRGDEIGNIYHPIWHAADRIFIHTSRVDNGMSVTGIFDVAIDPATCTFRGFTTLAFPHVIRDYAYDLGTGDFAITYSRTPADLQTVRARANQGGFAVEDTILGASWYPLCARFVAPGGGLVVYAHDPGSLVNGFYYVSSSPVEEDSLLLAVDLVVSDARGFDIAGGVLCYGRTESLESSTMSVIDLAGNQAARIVATLDGQFVSASVHPTGDCAIVSLNDLSRPGSVVGILDLATGAFVEVDVKTRRNAFVTADFASWNPAGNAFAFSSGGFDGEGGQYPRQLWVKKSTECQ